jgi:transcriptional regulator with XRE-family HTH domain
MADIGMKIKLMRISKGMRQEDLAEKLGLSKSSISGWETGTKEPSISHIEKLCDLFHTTPNYLLDRGIQETIKLDDKEKWMLTVFKEQTPEKMQDIVMSLFSYIHERHSAAEDNDVLFGLFTGFINTYGLRKLWEAYRFDNLTDELIVQRFFQRKRIREYIEALLNEEMPTEVNDISSAEYELMEQDKNEHHGL